MIDSTIMFSVISALGGIRVLKGIWNWQNTSANINRK